MACFPSRSTFKLLHNMNVIMKPFVAGCRFLFDTGLYENKEALFTLFSDEVLLFLFYPQDSQNFYNYSSGFSTECDGAMLFSGGKSAVIEEKSIDLGFGDFTCFDSAEFTDDETQELKAHRSPLIPSVYKVTTDQLLESPDAGQHYLNFRSLKTYYKYYVFNYREIENLKIQDVDKKIEFSGMQEQLENAKIARVFISTRPIMSLYQSRRHFQLMEESSGAPRVIMDYMPMPRPGCYYTDQVNGERVVVSEIFIN